MKGPIKKFYKALGYSKLALPLLNQEIERWNHEEPIIGTIEQIIKCKEQILCMIDQLESGRLPHRDRRRGGMGRMIVDEWPMGSELGNVLLAAEQNYRDAAESNEEHKAITPTR